MKKYTSKISLATLPGLKKTGIMVAIFAFFSWSTAQAETLEIWSFTDELKPVAADFEKRNPGVTVKYTTFALENYLNKLRPVLTTGRNAPDIFTGEIAIVKQFVDGPFWLDLSRKYKVDRLADNFVPAVWNLGKDSKGKVKALSWQATPGGFYYRRSLAKQYLGTDDPEKVSAMLANWDKFYATAAKIKQGSGGKVRMIGSNFDLTNPFLAQRQQGWVVGKKLNIDPAIDAYFDVAKKMFDQGLTAKARQWQPAWFNGMKDGSVFGYFLPTWGLHYVLKPNAEGIKSDYALARPPVNYYWGGTWIGIYAKSKKKDLAFKFIEMLTLDDEYMTEYAKRTGDFLSNLKVQKSLASLDDPFLAGQRHYEFFSNEAGRRDIAHLVTKYDERLNAMISESVNDYATGAKSKAAALKAFKENVANAYPNLSIK